MVLYVLYYIQLENIAYNQFGIRKKYFQIFLKKLLTIRLKYAILYSVKNRLSKYKLKTSKKFFKKFEKGIDKWFQMCYNK